MDTSMLLAYSCVTQNTSISILLIAKNNLKIVASNIRNACMNEKVSKK